MKELNGSHVQKEKGRGKGAVEPPRCLFTIMSSPRLQSGDSHFYRFMKAIVSMERKLLLASSEETSASAWSTIHFR